MSGFETLSSDASQPSMEAPDVVGSPEAEVADKIEISPNSSDITLAKLVEISAVFVEDTHSLRAKFF